MSHKKTWAPLDAHIFVVAHPIPEAPAEIIIFLFLRDWLVITYDLASELSNSLFVI